LAGDNRRRTTNGGDGRGESRKEARHIVLDDHARGAIAHRRARGRDTTITLWVTAIPHGGHVLLADWGPPHGSGRSLAHQRLGELELNVDERIARYARWHDRTISGWHRGPFENLTVVREPMVLLAMVRWEQTQPALGHASII
jgi:hypothetical protein